MFPYVAWIDGFHFAKEVLSVRLQKEFRFRLREVQGLGETYFEENYSKSLEQT